MESKSRIRRSGQSHRPRRPKAGANTGSNIGVVNTLLVKERNPTFVGVQEPNKNSVEQSSAKAGVNTDMDSKIGVVDTLLIIERSPIFVGV
jgi:hypothetical protein